MCFICLLIMTQNCKLNLFTKGKVVSQNKLTLQLHLMSSSSFVFYAVFLGAIFLPLFKLSFISSLPLFWQATRTHMLFFAYFWNFHCSLQLHKVIAKRCNKLMIKTNLKQSKDEWSIVALGTPVGQQTQISSEKQWGHRRIKGREKKKNVGDKVAITSLKGSLSITGTIQSARNERWFLTFCKMKT